jgi:lysine N6-hydroxylase
MQPLANRITWNRDGLPVRADFSVEWDAPPELRIYAQDAARPMRGVADPTSA